MDRADLRRFLLVGAVGFGAQVLQVLAVREVLGLVEGSEAAIGVALAGWLLGGAAGTLPGRRASERAADPERLLALAAPAAAILGAAALLAVRLVHWVLPLAPGQPPGLGTGLLLAGVGGFLPAVGFGIAFPAAARLLGGARAFAVEACGALAGGVLFTFALAPFVPPAGVAALVLSVAGAAGLAAAPRPAAAALVLGIAGVLAGPSLERASRAAHYAAFLPGHELLATAQSPRGPLDVLGLRGQASLYRHGHLDFTSPDPEGAALPAHLALCLHPSPRTVFLAGGGPGVLREMLLEPVERIDFADPDPAAIAAVESHLSPEDRAALRDPRVRRIAGDPRAALREAEGIYDVVALLGLEPSTAAANRFYTTDFFEAATGATREGGLLVLSLRGFGEYAPPDLVDRNHVVLKSMHWSFRPGVLPGEAGFVVGSKPGMSAGWFRAPGAEILAGRFRERGVRSAGMRAEHFHLLVPEGETARLEALYGTPAGILDSNSDSHPSGYFRTFLLRAAESGWPAGLLPGPASAWAIAAILVAAVLLLGFRGRPGDASVASTGFCGMGAVVVILLGYQCSRGDLYGEMGLVASLFMAGLAYGSLRGKLPEFGARDWHLVVPVSVGVGAYGHPLLALLISLAVGLAVGAFLRSVLAEGGDPGRIYALDLAGSALGALLVGTWILPAFGTLGTCVLLGGLKTASGLAARIRTPASPP